MMFDTEIDNGNRRACDMKSLGDIKLAGSPYAGWTTYRLFKDGFFIKALLLMLCCGGITGFLQFFYMIGKIPVFVKDLFSLTIYIGLYAGSMWLIRFLNKKILVLIFVNAVIIVIWQNIIFYKQPLIATFTIIVTLWLAFYLTWTEPEIMANFGLRKNRIAADLAMALILSAIITVYTILSFKAYGYTFKVDPLRMAAHAALAGDYVVVFSFVYLVWNRLLNKGLSLIGLILVSSTLVMFFQAPTLIAAYWAGELSGARFALAFVSSAMLFVLLIWTTFRTMKNPFPAAIMMTVIHEILVMAGA